MSDPYEHYPQNRPMAHPGTQAHEYVDKTPLCPWCNQPMESTGEFREIELDAGEFVAIEEVYECRDCDYDEHEW